MSGDETTVLIEPGPGEHGIPLDVVVTLTGVISMAYPNAKMGAGLGGRGFTLILDKASRRAKKVGKRAAAAAHEPMEEGVDVGAGFTGFDGETIRMATPEWLSLQLAGMGMALLNGMEGATNYVTIPAENADGQKVLVTIQRPEGKSPHELRTEAVAERDALAAKMDHAKANLLAVVDLVAPEPVATHVRAALAALTDPKD